ncbi:EAL domain-containing protein, partial [Janthinobacterium sp. BJB401]|nr:EAL domain-containing protein [Janthinobacterium sp. BJB401]
MAGGRGGEAAAGGQRVSPAPGAGGSGGPPCVCRAAPAGLVARLARFWQVALARLCRAPARSRELQRRLDSAIAGGEFCFHYQGKFDTAQLRLVGLEALLRWNHPRHGLVYPNEFICLAEQTGAITALGNWGIDAACRQLAQWRAQGLPLVPVAVNISARQLCQPQLPAQLPDFVLGCLRRHAIPACLLE